MPDWRDIGSRVRGGFRYVRDGARAVPSKLKLLHYHLYGYSSGNYTAWFEYRKQLMQEFTARNRRLRFLERFLPRFERAASRKQKRWDESVRSSSAYTSDVEALNKKHAADVGVLNDRLAAEQKTAGGLASAKSELEWKVERLEKDPRLRLGEHIIKESPCGVLELDMDNRIMGANANACTYLGMDIEDILGKTPSEVVHEEEFVRNYLAIFEANARDLVREGVNFQPNTMNINSAPFDIMAYASNTGTRKFPVYGGGFVVLSPFKSQGVLAKLFARYKSVVSLEGEVTFDVLLDHYASHLVMASKKKPVYVDFKHVESITGKALNTLAKFYHVFRKQGASFIFKNMTDDIAQYLVGEKNVDEAHLRGVKFTEKGRLAYEAGR